MPKHRRLRGVEVRRPGRRIFLDHGEAYGNLGDEAMLRSALLRLEQHLGPATFVLPREGDRPLPDLTGYTIEIVPSPYQAFALVDRTIRAKRLIGRLTGREPFEVSAAAARVAAAASLLSRLSGQFRLFRDALASCDAFYGVGAADFNDFNALGAAYKCWLYEYARRIVPVVVVASQGFGPLTRPGLARLMRRAFNSIDVLTFRDCSFSERFTKTLGPLRCETKIVGDEAFCLPPAADPERDAYLVACGIAPDERYIAVHWRATDYTRDTERYYPRVAAAFDQAVERVGARLLYVPMSYDVHSRHDEDCGKAIRALMRHGDRMQLGVLTRDVRLIKTVIGGALFSFGLSYHVHVFSLAQGKPAVILSSGEYYRYKSDGLVGFYGPPCAALDVEAAPSAIAAALDGVMSDYDGARARIAAVNARLTADNEWSIERLAALLSRCGR